MRHIYLFAFTKQAAALSSKIYHFFSAQNENCTAFTLEKYANTVQTALQVPLKEQVKSCFHTENVLIFISACGIAVRSIAPFIKSKTTDPCVLVIDELGQFVISLLSGHIGGGNEMTRSVASAIGATPIISTATDLNNTFAVDVFAKKNGLTISDMKLAKEISACLLDKKPVGIAGTIPFGPLPSGLTKDTCEIGISISAFFKNAPFPSTLHLIPRQVVLGIGCKKGIAPHNLSCFVKDILEQQGIFQNAVAAITSIDLKKEEPAIVQLAEQFSVPYVTYDAQTLLNVSGNFSSSVFVQSVTGVDNVCERSSLAYSKADTLLLPKTARNGMTIAISLLPLSLTY